MTDRSMFFELDLSRTEPGSGALRSYRIYHVGGGGRLNLGETFTAPGDAEAVQRARGQLIRAHAAELWEGGRLVGRFSKAHDFTSGG